MKLSIIICVYNTDVKYLEECIKSIVHSTLFELEGGYEICIVDDGSSVDYTQLVETYNLRYQKTENRGILMARSTGIEMARGEYVAFCDSDDTVTFHYYAPMVRRAMDTGAEIVINDWAFHAPNIRYYCKNDDLISSDFDVSGNNTLLAFFKNEGRQHSFYVLWNKVYKASLLQRAFRALHNSDYPKNSSYSEDAAINFFAWRDAVRIVNVHTGFYFYRLHEGQSVNITSEEKLRRQILSMSACFDLMRSNIGDHPHKDDMMKSIREWECMMARAHFSQAKAAKFESLFALIKDCYHMERLTLSKLKDSEVYAENVLLGKNFDLVESCLFKVWNSNHPISVYHSSKDRYTHHMVISLATDGKVNLAKKGVADIIIPKEEIPFRKKILYQRHVYKLGLVVFKKGSKIRSLLKKIL